VCCWVCSCRTAESEDGGTRSFENLGNYMPTNMVQHSRRLLQEYHCVSFKLYVVESRFVIICATENQKMLCNFVLLQTSGIGEPSVHHAVVVIFLEFFAWGLLTMPVISVSI
jgi:hypothetical protein